MYTLIQCLTYLLFLDWEANERGEIPQKVDGA